MVEHLSICGGLGFRIYGSGVWILISIPAYFPSYHYDNATPGSKRITPRPCFPGVCRSEVYDLLVHFICAVLKIVGP